MSTVLDIHDIQNMPTQSNKFMPKKPQISFVDLHCYISLCLILGNLDVYMCIIYVIILILTSLQNKVTIYYFL